MHVYEVARVKIGVALYEAVLTSPHSPGHGYRAGNSHVVRCANNTLDQSVRSQRPPQLS
jgi:hypothetical protein